MPRHSRQLPLRLRQRVDGWRLQREHRRLCQCRLLPRCYLPRPRSLFLLRVSSWAHRYDSAWRSQTYCTPDEVMIQFDDNLFLWCSQVCCATSMTPASAIHVKRVPTVTPTQSMAKQSAPVPQVTPGQPATWILMSAPLVSYKVNTFFLLV